MITFKALTLPEEWEWVKRRTHIIACEDSQGIVAYSGDRIDAVCVADSFTEDGCTVHFAIDNPMVIRKGFFTEVADHLYGTCGRQRLFGLVPENNSRALRLDQKIGFSIVSRVPDAIKTGVGYVIMVMEKEACRWRTDTGGKGA